MAKYSGKIGFADVVETEVGVWEERIIEKVAYGDLVRNFKRTDSSQYLNDNINISNNFSIVGNPYFLNNINRIRYLTWMGSKWKVTSVDVQYPRLVLEVGGLYNDGQ